MKYLIYHAFKMQNCKLLQTEFCLKNSKKLHREVRIILPYSNSRCRKPAQKFGKYFDKQANTFWNYLFKGQLILKCLFGVLIWTKIATKYCQDFCPEILCSFLEASWALFGLPGDLVSNIINKEAYRNPKKLPGSPQEDTKNSRAETPSIFSLLFWSKRWHQKDISKLTDL